MATTHPGQVKDFIVAQGDNNSEINLSWTDPESFDLEGILIVRNTTGSFTPPSDETTYPDGSGPGGDWCKNISPEVQLFTDSGLEVNTTYYRAYSYDEVFNYSSGVPSSPDGIKPKDGLSPSVSITWPLSGDMVSGTVQITTSVSDNTGVVRVEFLVDGSVFASHTSPPYRASWDTTGVADGEHNLKARA